MIKITYLDNSGNIRKFQTSGRGLTISGAVISAELEANEIGHGVQAIILAVKEGE